MPATQHASSIHNRILSHFAATSIHLTIHAELQKMENGEGAQAGFDVDLAEKIKVVRASGHCPYKYPGPASEGQRLLTFKSSATRS
jgi:hypothetical protein